MLNVTGKAKVYQIKEDGKASLGVSKKKQDDTWETHFFNAKFVGKCKDKFALLNNKDKINITSAVIENRPYEKDGQKRTFLEVVVFDFESEEKAQEEPQEGFIPIEIDDELPF